MTGTGQLVVSIHDVSPPEWGRVARTLARLADAGVRRCSLLVIPTFRGQWPIQRHRDFCLWLRERQDEGHEIVLHGYEHVGVGVPTTLGERFRNRWYTQGEGEFLSLDYDEACRRIDAGLALFSGAGLRAHGFVAPAWLINRQGLRAAADRGLQYTNSYLKLVDLQQGRSYMAPSLVFGPGSLDEDLGIALQRRLSALLALSGLVRVVLHPPCIDRIDRFAEVLRMIARQLERHEPVTYLDAVTSRRTAGAGVPDHSHAG